MQIVEYADWALRQFFEEARKQPWFDNTIFVLEGIMANWWETPNVNCRNLIIIFH